MISQDIGYKMRRSLMKDGCPAAYSIIAATAVLFFVGFLAPPLAGTIAHWIGFRTDTWLHTPWTLITGSIAPVGPIEMLFGGLMLWWFGGSLERALGTRTFLKLWSGLAAITALALWLGTLALHSGPTMLSFGVVVDTMIVVWGLMNRFAVVRLWCILPVSGLMIALLSAFFVLINYGPGLGIFALAGCASGWAFVEYRVRQRRYQGVTRIPARRRNRQAPEGSDGLMGRVQGWQANRRIEKLLRDSGYDDTETNGRR